MEIIRSIEELNIEGKTAIALGKFDGIHIGHVKLLNEILKKKAQGYKALVFTFDTSATSFFTGKSIKEVTTIEEKEYIFEKMGVDILFEYPLNSKTASISPEDFIFRILVEKLKMQYIVAGSDVSFGSKGAGDAKLLAQMAKVYGYELEIIDKLLYEGREVSSTFVREEIEKGNMRLVSKLLGHPYYFAGIVSKGKQLGRTIGMPTMNQYPDEKKILPPYGVYYSRVCCQNKWYNSITNIGMRPTVSNENHISVETYLYDFDGDMYGENIVTQVLEFKRPEMKFNGLEELKAQMAKDIEEGAIFHATYNND